MCFKTTFSALPELKPHLIYRIRRHIGLEMVQGRIFFYYQSPCIAKSNTPDQSSLLKWWCTLFENVICYVCEFVCVCACAWHVCEHAYHVTYGVQRTTVWSQFSAFFFTWAPGIKIRSAVLWGRHFTHWVISGPRRCTFFYLFCYCCCLLLFFFHLLFIFFFLSSYFLIRLVLCIPDWSGTCYQDQVVLELIQLQLHTRASTSSVLGSKAYKTVPCSEPPLWPMVVLFWP